MKIWRSRKSWEAVYRALIEFQLRFADGLTLCSRNNQRFGRIAGTGHLDETIVMSVGAGQFHVKVVAVWKCANGFRRDDNTFLKSSHGSTHWNIAKWFCKYLVTSRSNPDGIYVSADIEVEVPLKAAPVLARSVTVLLRYLHEKAVASGDGAGKHGCR